MRLHLRTDIRPITAFCWLSNRHSQSSPDWSDHLRMSINAVSNLQSASTNYQIAVAVAAKSLDAQRDQGAAEIKMIQAAAQTMDKAAAAIAEDGSLDVYA